MIKIIVGIFAAFIGFAIVMIVISLKYDFIDANYRISQDNKQFSASKILREKDGCIYFIETWTNAESKICGNYAVKDWSKKNKVN